MKILMVCLGNICRSPLAEALLRHTALSKGIKLEVDSAGTASYHIGCAPDTRTIQNALLHNIDLRNLKARQFTKSDFENFDFIFTMDTSNYTNVLSLTNEAFHKSKVYEYAKFTELGVDKIPDPYYGTEKDFELVFQLLKKGSEKLLNKIFVQ
jgi:protein-tyrosine phosphatase